MLGALRYCSFQHIRGKVLFIVKGVKEQEPRGLNVDILQTFFMEKWFYPSVFLKPLRGLLDVYKRN